MFNSLSFVMESESAFSFQVKPNFFFIMIGLFIGIFIITAAISSIYQKKRVNLKRACFPEAGFFICIGSQVVVNLNRNHYALE